MELTNEHLDHTIRDLADRMDRRLYRVSRCRRIDSHPARAGRNFVDFAFRHGKVINSVIYCRISG